MFPVSCVHPPRILVGEIITGVAENSAVIGYLGFSDDLWIVLPDLGVNFTFQPRFAEVRIDSIRGISSVRFLDGLDLRFVVIYPPAMGKLGNVNIENYEAVMRALDYP